MMAAFLAAASAVLSETGAVPQRSDIDEKDKWRTEDIYPSLEAWETDFALLQNSVSRFEDIKGHIGDSPASMLACFQLSDSLNLVLENLYVYAHLRLDEDNRESQFQELTGRISTFNTEFSEATSYIEPEILALDWDQVDQFLNSDRELGVYRQYLVNMFRQNEHVLSPEEEVILALAGSVTAGPNRIFSMLNDADVSYGTIYDEDSNEVALTKQRYYRYLESPNRRLRRDANRVYNEGYLKYVNTLSATLDASVKQDVFYMKARGYESCLKMSLDNYNIPTAVFHKLIAAVNDNLSTLHKWTAVRKRILGYDTLYTYDLYAPLVDEPTVEYSYEEAERIIVEGLAPMKEPYLQELEKGFNSGWVDVYETQGKGSGAYSWGTYSTHPFVLMNYNGTLDNVFTLAHEMGHAMHSTYTRRNEPYIYGDNSLFVAEVASTCNEAILMKYMLANASDKDETMRLLSRYIEQIIGTFFTQVMFSEFELAIHNQIESGNAISADFLRKTYRDIYQKYWGPELVIDEINDLGGMRIPHFYRQYYVYQYATSFAAAQMISQRIMSEEEGALDSYLKFLSTGTSKYPIDILKDAGVDMTQPEAVEATIRIFGELVDEMTRLLDE